ncbi:AMP-binding protein [Chloroflexota bacterium]
MTDQFDFGGEIAWRPTPEYLDNARLTEFMKLNDISSYDQLSQRSTEDIAWFSDALLKFLEIEFYEPYSKVVDLSDGIKWPKWCLDGKLNIIHNCLDKYIGTPTENKTAFIWEGEEGDSASVSYGELNQMVNQTANALRQLGVGKGDAVGLFMPMTLEIVAAFLAIAKIGGIIVPLFSGYGVSACVTRLSDTDAKALFTSDGFYRRGKVIPIKGVADDAAQQLPNLKHMIVTKRVGIETPMQPGRDHWWDEIVATQPTEAETEVTEAEDVLMIIYTSGTTGEPKGAVHTHCGFPVKSAQDMAFGMDLHADEIIYWITDMGWMMGPWLVFGALLIGGTAFIYDGAMDFPGPDRLWAMIEKHKINLLGLSPTLIRALMPHGLEPIQSHDLSSLRAIGSTGEPWNPGPWKWMFDNVLESRKPVINYTGGTEVGGGILMGNPVQPIKPCGFPSPTPGIAADIYNEDGQPVRGEVGELVVKAPWIGLTRGFWKNPERYENTYWNRWPETYVHGDWAAVDADGQWYLLGRSDDTIKVAGKRLGPAEIESIAVDHPGVVEAAAIGAPHEIKGSEVILFCVPHPEAETGETLVEEIRQMIVEGMGKPLTPKQVHFVSDLPKTRNAKVMRRMVRSAYLDLDLGDTSSLLNPEALEEIKSVR